MTWKRASRAKLADAPQDDEAFSRYVAKCLNIVKFSGSAKILDLPCGQGRNTFWLAGLGHEIVAADLDDSRVVEVSSIARRNSQSSILAVVCDAANPLPFEEASFDLVLIVHYVSNPLLSNIHSVVKPDGYLIYETFGLQGRNGLALPVAGETARVLAPWFNMLDYRERTPKTLKYPGVAVKLLGQKR